MLKPFPRFATDEEAEAFVASADLSEYDFSEFRPFQFKFTDKPVRLDVELSGALMTDVHARAVKQGVSDSEYVAGLIRKDLAASQ